ncbi:AbgT family transporter [Phormidium yuhuli AB48]|uniref:AbgT family transporter n=1 Tax=Phormidium yuhuli AB48 TaxID=2940671 RepID=A0ABY5ANF5_9CYAN|nr:AbgT family transporter [Phormidium yuhuli]USR90747.1 AbgT family transporter [Phormidium yuhuli AB48]
MEDNNSPPSESPRPSTGRLRGLDRVLGWIERVGNALPDPVTLFLILAIGVILLSALAAAAGLSVLHPATEETLTAVSLLSAEGLRRMVTEAVQNFVQFPPLGPVLVAMLGVGLSEYTGLLSAALRWGVSVTPLALVSPGIVFLGVMSNLASDAGYVVLTPLAAMLFAAVGRHPISGLAAAFAGVSGGFSANLLIGTLDPLLAGISQEAAAFLDADYVVNPTGNYYFMAASTFVITLVGWWMTDKVVEPRLGSYEGDRTPEDEQTLTAAERKGLRWAFYALLAVLAGLALLVLPPNAILRDPETGSLVPSPFLNGIVILITLGFLIPGIAYGMAAGTVRNDKDVVKGMSTAMSAMGYYIVLSFVAAQFIAYFSWSNLGVILAVNGANVLEGSGLTGIALLLGFVLLSALINLFIGSASAQWAIMAPIFVPMLMLLGYTPEVTQLVFRIGDSASNIITPLMVYFPLIVAFGQRFEKNLKIGTLIATMLPYSLAFLMSWSLFFALWFVLGLPLGPGAGIRLV